MEPTPEQIEAAAKRMYGVSEMVLTVDSRHPDRWENKPHSFRERWLICAREAAPLLQMPLTMPTEEETRDIYNDEVKTGFLIVSAVIVNFVNRRNAALRPPVDPRREKIVRSLLFDATTVIVSVEEAHRQADRILAALDAKD